MRLLELFSGTGSVGQVFKEKGWEVISLDSNPKTNASIITDIRNWDYQAYKSKHFDAIWASPCCTHYSCARRGAKTPRDLEGADSLVITTLDIIKYLNPKVWYIENPQTGLLKDREFMKGLPYTDLDYCRYCDIGFRKRTRIWTNTKFEGLKCLGQGKCPNMEGSRHKATAQQGRNTLNEGSYGGTFKQSELYRIPQALILRIENSIAELSDYNY